MACRKYAIEHKFLILRNSVYYKQVSQFLLRVFSNFKNVHMLPPGDVAAAVAASAVAASAVVSRAVEVAVTRKCGDLILGTKFFFIIHAKSWLLRVESMLSYEENTFGRKKYF